ncbi:MAG: HDOD domain-containing protein [Calditrichaeota bacterium]|nr:MAG: HDOD domain-containing protein [Calditrichota bacterium]
MEQAAKEHVDVPQFDPGDIKTPDALELEVPFLENRFNLAQLPSLPTVILKLDYVLEKNRPAIKDIISTVLADPALTIRVLCLLSQVPSYNPQNSLTVSRVIHFRGLRPIRNLFGGLTIFNENNALEQQSGFSLFTFWKHSAFSALAAEAIAEELKFENVEEAYLAGLLHDVGRLILARFSPIASRKFAKLHHEHESELQLEERIFHITHTDAGSQLAEMLRLPRSLVEVMKYHHFEQLPTRNLLLVNPLIKVVHVAESIAKLFYMREKSTHYFYEGKDRAAEQLKMPLGTYKKVVRTVSNRIYELMDSVHLSLDVFQSYGRKLENASVVAEQLREKLAASQSQLHALQLKDKLVSELLPQLLGKNTREGLLKYLTATIHVHGNVNRVVLFLHDKGKGMLQSKLTYGLPKNDNLRWAKLDIDGPGVIPSAFQQRKAYNIRVYHEEMQEDGLFDYEELKYVKKIPFAAVPIHTTRENIGVLYLSQGNADEWLSEEEVKVFESVCNLVGRAIESRSR